MDPLQTSPRQLTALALAIALGAAISLGITRFAYGLLLPSMRVDLGWSYALAGAMNTANATGYFLGALACPWLMRRFGPSLLLVAGSVLAGVFMVGSGFVTQTEGLLAQRLLAGVASALVFVAGGLLAARLGARDPQRSGLLLGIYYGGTGVGIVLSSLLVPVALEAAQGALHGWRWAWWGLGALCLVFSLVLVWPARVMAAWAAPVAATGAVPATFRWRPFGFGLAGYTLFGVGYIGYMTFVVALLRRPESPQTHEIAIRDGRVIELRLDPLPEDGFVATCNDVTARVRTAEALRDSDGQLRRAAETLEQRVAERTAELEASRAEAEAANLGKTRFIAAASHDLLQPLHAARLFTAAMIDRDPRNDLGGKIDASLGAVESLLDALLDISKLDAGAFKPEKRPFALQPLFESLATAFAPTATRYGVELVIAPTSAFVDTDPAFLRRVLQNLLSNALRYGRAEGRPGRVLLGCRRVGDALRIEVRDNGPGIAPDKQAVIFDEFVRLQPEDEGPREERGLGLGLAIVDRIARMLDLPVGLASAPGRGSTFSVTVPRVAAVVTPPSAAPAPQPLPSIEAESFVLCLDNEARVREAMAVLLGGWGCKVATAASPAEALDAVARAGRLPDLVLADLHLDEGADGLDAVVALREAWGRAVPAALVTADRDPTLRLRARAQQVELLHKPVKPASLRALLRLRSSAAGRLTA